MDVPARGTGLSASIIGGSDEICDFFCQPCSHDNINMPAEGYCIDCKEYLCGTCFKYHRKQSAMRHHVLLDKNKMPCDKRPTKVIFNDECTDQCPDHTGRATEYYCKEHDQLGCSVCMTINHRSCNGVSFIPEISSGIEKTCEFIHLKQKLVALDQTVYRNKAETKANYEEVDILSNEANAEIGDFINKISNLFDTLQTAMSHKVKVIRDEDMSLMNLISDKCDSIKSDITSMSSDLDSKQKAGQNNRLFLAMKRAENEIKLVEDDIKKIKSDNKIRKYKFVPEMQIVDLIDKLKKLGKVSVCEEINEDGVPEHEARVVVTASSREPQNQKIKGLEDSSTSVELPLLEQIRPQLLQMLPDISKDEDNDFSDADFDVSFDDNSDENNDELNYRETFKSIQSNSSKNISIGGVRHEVFMALQHFYKADWDITVGMRVAIDYKNNGIVLRSENHNKVLMASVWVREALQDLEGFYFDEIAVVNTSGAGTSADKRDHKDVLKASYELKAQSNWRDVQVYLHDRVVKVAGFSFEIVMEFKECVKRKIAGHTPTPRRHRQLNEITIGKLTEDRALENTNTSVIKFKQQASIRTLNKTPKSAEKYTTKEGLVVYVYKQSLLRLEVDCIVNAANDTLQHCGGIAKAIADAAGKELDFESKEYIKKKGKLRVGNCCNTTAGKLPYQCVIHTVGPRKRDYSKNQTEQLQSDLCSAVFVCLNEARNYGLTTIGIPSISSDIFGVPKQTCALQYCKAVLDYSKLFGNDILKQIHFVDNNDRMIELIQTTFAALINQDKAAEKRLSEKRYKKRNNTYSKQTESSEKLYPQQKWERRNNQSVCIFELSGYFKVVVKSGDITQFSTGAITCPQDSQLTNESGVAKAILEKDRMFKETIKQERKRSGHSFSTGEVIFTKPCNLSCSSIFNIIVPSLRRREHAKYSDELKMCYSQLFHVANKYGIRQLALPLLGPGKRGGKPEFLSVILMEAIIEVCNSQTKVDTLKEVHVINKSKDETKSVIKRLTEYIDGEKGAYNDKNKAASDNKISSSCENEEFKTPPDSQHVCPNENRRIEDTDEIQQRSIKDNPLSALEQTYCDENQTGHTNYGEKHVDNDNTKSIAIETCPICMDKLDNPKVLHKCGHKFCTECIEQYFKVKPVCPNCFTVYGVLTGYQPKGTMYQSVIDLNLPGYERYKTIKINYSFHDGIQTEDHPKPGQPYYGTKRTAYLPDCNEGRKVLKLLRIAFDRKLVFTIGWSVTTGQEDVVTWNDIHHKTHTHGGLSNFGYPDPGYMQRVQDELAAKGVTED